jgi:hypothetical protein
VLESARVRVGREEILEQLDRADVDADEASAALERLAEARLLYSDFGSGDHPHYTSSPKGMRLLRESRQGANLSFLLPQR